MNKRKTFTPNQKYSAHTEKMAPEIGELQTVVNDLKEAARINLSTAHTRTNRQESQTMIADGHIG